jgi:hypothetical protein
MTKQLHSYDEVTRLEMFKSMSVPLFYMHW